MKKINLSIKFGNKTFYTLIAIISLLIIAGVVYAYHSGSQPSVFGHSAEEIEVEVGGTTMTLQEAVDSGILGSGGGFGSWEEKSVDTVYQAATNGFVCAEGTKTRDYFYVEGLTGTTSTNLIRRVVAGDGKYVQPNGICMPVAKEEYWKVYVKNGNANVYWRDLN